MTISGTADSSAEYADIVRRMVKVEPISGDEFLLHFDHQNANPCDGIAVGTRAPDFTVNDQYGRGRTSRELYGPAGLLLVFVRSAHWCPYCRQQVVELNLSLDEVRERGVNVVTVSPDSVENLRAFSDRYGIRFPMLSDVGSHIISSYELLNPNFDATPLDVGVPFPQRGVPFPGHFLIDADGVVVDKAFSGDLRHRASGSTLVTRQLGPSDRQTTVELRTDELVARITLSATTAYGGQDLGMHASFSIAPGWHVYGDPVPSRYRALAIAFDDALLAEQSFELPPAAAKALPALDEALPAYEGDFEATGRLRIKWRPVMPNLRGVDEFNELSIPAGDHMLRGTVSYQCCSESECLLPRTLDFELPVRIEEDLPYAVPEA
jgi:peroxiredoxin